jgi:hypothetical protein
MLCYLLIKHALCQLVTFFNVFVLSIAGVGIVGVGIEAVVVALEVNTLSGLEVTRILSGFILCEGFIY